MIYVDVLREHLNVPVEDKKYLYLCELFNGEYKYFCKKEDIKGILLATYEYVSTYGEYDHYTKIEMEGE